MSAYAGGFGDPSIGFGVPMGGQMFPGQMQVPQMPTYSYAQAAPEPPAESATVYVGNLNWLTTGDDLRAFFEGANVGQVYHVDMQTHEDGRSKGWALVEFASLEVAQNVVSTLNDATLQDRRMTIRLDRKRYEKQRVQMNQGGGQYQGGNQVGGLAEQKGDDGDLKTLYVGNLPWEVNDEDLEQIFSTYSPVSCRVTIGRDGRSRGYGIVKLPSQDAVAAIQNMNNLNYSGRKLNVRYDQGKSGGGVKQRGGRGGATRKNVGNGRGVGGPQNRNYEATVYVGNLPWSTSWQELKDLFAEFGPEYVDVKVGSDGRSRGWGTVRFADMASAEAAIAQMNGYEIEGHNGIRAIEVRKDRGPTRN